jgi:release factor glutamine methyltransferase
MVSVHSLLTTVWVKYSHVPKRHFRVLLANLLQKSSEFLIAHPELEVPSHIYEKFFKQAEKLSLGVPLSRLLGKREFWGREFKLSEATLDPRPDSETLIEAILQHRQNRTEPLKILDLGTGSGCLIISLLREYPNASGMAVDASDEALRIASQNAQIHAVEDRLSFYLGDWFEGIQGKFDVIISNPPYISEAEYEYLDSMVKNYDPKKALLAGREGLACYEIIIPQAMSFLNERGMLVLEIGCGQRESVEKLMRQNGFDPIQMYQDLSGIERCLIGFIREGLYR